MNQSLKHAFDLSGRVVVITGGAGLLGRKHTEAIAEFGGVPVLLDIVDEVGNKIAEDISSQYAVNCQYIHCDITNENEIIQARDTIVRIFGHIDALINNAALDPKVGVHQGKNLSRLENFPLEQWNVELSVGLTGAMLCCKIIGRELIKTGHGVILNVSSDLGIMAPDQRLYTQDGLTEDEQPVKPVTYSVLKHGLIGLTKYIATYWADKGLRCNALCPGGVYTNQSDDFVQKLSRLNPLGRMADVDEYKGAIVFLTSDASSYMTGANLVIDGGRTCW